MKPTVLIISGWAHGLDAIKPMGEKLADHFRVQLLTGSQVLNDQKIPSVDFIITGSMGGLLAIELLPERCKKLVLISSTAKFCASEGYDCGTPKKILRRMILQLKRNPEPVLEAFFKNVHFPHQQRRRSFQLRYDEAALNELLEGLEYLLNSDVRQKIPSLEIPVLLLHGAEDRIIPATASEWLNVHLPDSRLEIFKNGGHALPAHRFAEVMNEISRFL